MTTEQSGTRTTEEWANAIAAEVHRTGLAVYQVAPDASSTVQLFAAAIIKGDCTPNRGAEYGAYVDAIEDLEDGIEAMPFYTWLRVTVEAEIDAVATREAYARFDN